MKILYEVPDLSVRGGIQQFALTISKVLENEHQIEVRDWQYDLPLYKKAILKAAPDEKGADLFKKFSTDGDYDRFDLVHFWHPEAAMGVKTDHVVSVHGREILPPNVSGFRRVLFPEVFRNANIVHVNSHYTKNLLMKIYTLDQERIRVIPPPLTVDIFDKKKGDDEGRTVGTLCRLISRKNVSNIIEAMSVLDEQNVNFRYVLAGKGPLKNKILKKLKASDFRWEYLGEISEEYKRKSFYPSLDVFVLPPVRLKDEVEGFGIVFIEANAYGVPVVAARTGGVVEAVEEGVSGVFSDPNDPRDIADKVRYLLDRKDEFDESTKRWAAKFKPDRLRGKFESMYKDALGGVL